MFEPIALNTFTLIHNLFSRKCEEESASGLWYLKHECNSYRHQYEGPHWVCSLQKKRTVWFKVRFSHTGSSLRCETDGSVTVCNKIPVTFSGKLHSQSIHSWWSFSDNSQASLSHTQTNTHTHRVRAESMSRTSFAKCFLCFWIFGISTWEDRAEIFLQSAVLVWKRTTNSLSIVRLCTCSSRISLGSTFSFSWRLAYWLICRAISRVHQRSPVFGDWRQEAPIFLLSVSNFLSLQSILFIDTGHLNEQNYTTVLSCWNSSYLVWITCRPLSFFSIFLFKK